MSGTTSDFGPTSAGLPWRDSGALTDLAPTVLRDPGPDDVPEVTGVFPHGWLPRAADDVASSWLRQVTVVEGSGVTVRLQACLDVDGRSGVAGDQRADRSAPTWPLAQPLLVIGAVRGPSVTFPREATSSREELARHLERSGAHTIPATTLDRGHAWVEPSIVATRGTLDGTPVEDWQARALDGARRMGITTVVRVQDGTWDVLALAGADGPRFEVVASAACSITRDEEHRCPMQQAPAAGQYCHMRGGPWTSASIHAAAGWQHHRDLLVAAVGCDTCAGVRYQFQGRLWTGGGPITVTSLAMPTRWLVADETRLGDAHAG